MGTDKNGTADCLDSCFILEHVAEKWQILTQVKDGILDCSDFCLKHMSKLMPACVAIIWLIPILMVLPSVTID